MEQANHFSQGMQHDADPQFQPADSYPEAFNLLLNAGANLQQERGDLPLPSGPTLSVVGHVILGSQEILFSTDGTTSEIGVQENEVYMPALTTTSFVFGAYVSAEARLDYRGHRLIYFADGKRLRFLDLDADLPILPDGLDLLPAPSRPTITPTATGTSGDLPTGIYQASVSLLSGSKNPICYSLFTNPIPVVSQGETVERSDRDGAPPQTPATGSIQLHLDNLPPGYSYAQVIIATYLGVSNQLSLYTLPLIALGGRPSLDYTYYSFSQHQSTITLGAVLAGLADYNRAKSLLQKDGRLLAANVGSAEPLNIDWQAIANGIRLGPIITEVPFLEAGTGGNDYRNPLSSTNMRGYQRDEVYSFCLIPVVDGRKLDAYHIPGCPLLGGAYTLNTFAPYYSQEQYPLDQTVVTDDLYGNAIRHHRMPSLLQEPMLSNATEAGGTIRLLGIREVTSPDFSNLPPAVLAKMSGYYIGVQARTQANKSILAQGLAQPLVPTGEKYDLLMVSPFNGKWPAVKNPTNFNPKGDGTYAAFYSPETQILGLDSPGVTTLSVEGQLSGFSKLVADKRDGARKDKYAHTFFHYYNLQTTAQVPAIGLVAPTRREVLPADDHSASLPEGSTNIYTWLQNGYTLLKSNTPNGFYAGLTDNDEDIYYQESSTDNVYLRRQSDQRYLNQDDAGHYGGASRYLYNLRIARPRQYGTLDQATYYPVAYRSIGYLATDFFGGDTFIGKVAIQHNTAESNNSDTSGLQFRSLSYFFCESTLNAAYRHFLPVGQLSKGTLPYYPKLKVLWADAGTGVMQYPNSLGHATGYNRQYSFTNTLNPAFPHDNTITKVTRFTNRVLYSELAVEGEQLDAYRLFLANNYHDVPKDKGSITQLWNWSGSLFIHCTQTLYRAFFNEATTHTTSEGEVNLGNGGLFPRPSVQLLSLDGGYAGCQHPKTGITTPNGHFFLDKEGKRAFMFNGQLQELSNKGMRNWFRDHLSHEDPNPIAAYDYEQERLMLYNMPSYGISYSTRNQQWVSFHSASPDYVLSSQRRFLNSTANQLSVSFAGFPQDCYLRVITNESPAEGKVFDVLKIHSSNVPLMVSQTTATEATYEMATLLHTDYGQQASEAQSLIRLVNDHYQYPTGRSAYSNARLKGNWLSSITRWSAVTVPTIIRQVSALFRPSIR